MKTAGLGVVLGVANALAITIGVGLTASFLDALWVALMLTIPSLIAGVLVGVVADSLRARSPWLRAPILIVLAWSIGVVLASFATQLGVFVSAAVPCVPAIAAALLIERGTREQPSGLPVARVTRG